MAEIQLSQGQVAVVDDEDYSWLSQWNWYACRGKNGFYAQRKHGSRGAVVLVLMHRLIVDAPDNQVVDHRNHNSLDNRRGNLRVCSVAENVRNARPHKRNKTGFKGVHFTHGGFIAQIVSDGRLYWLGKHPTPEDAARAYDRAAARLHGDFAFLNFPSERAA